MMSRCTICGAGTDLALSDVLTDAQLRILGGAQNVPLVGTCGKEECIERELQRQEDRMIYDTDKGPDDPALRVAWKRARYMLHYGSRIDLADYEIQPTAKAHWWQRTLGWITTHLRTTR